MNLAIPFETMDCQVWDQFYLVEYVDLLHEATGMRKMNGMILKKNTKVRILKDLITGVGFV